MREKKSAGRARNQALAKAFEILPDAWSFQVMQESFLGANRFEKYLEPLAIPRATLTARLKSLSRSGIFKKIAYSKRPVRYEYHLTDKGKALFPALLVLSRYGDIWLQGGATVSEPPLHKDCGCPTEPQIVCSCCLEPIDPREVSYGWDPELRLPHRASARRARRSSDSAGVLHGRSSSFSRALHVVGDRWTGQILGEAFCGATRFDDFQARLHIGPNILADRLTRLVTFGVFERRLYQSVPDRFEYRLTEMGLALYGFLVFLMEWSDKWISKGTRSTILTHNLCNKVFVPRLICDQCSKPILADSIQYSG